MTTRIHGDIVEAGVLAGLLGGVAMALFATIYAGAAGLGFWSPLEAIAATALHSSTIVTGAGAVIVGLLLHLIMAMFFGVIFAALTPPALPPLPAFAFGLLMGVATLVLMSLLIVPAVNPAVRSELMWGSAPGAMPVGAAFVMHLFYGAGLSIAPALRRRMAGVAQPTSARRAF